MSKVGLKLNLAVGGLTQIANWDFTSFSADGSKVYATNSDGLCEMCGDTDNELPINSKIVTPYSIHSIEHPKRLRRLYLRAAGPATLNILATPGDIGFNEDIKLTEAMESKYMKGHRGFRGPLWQFIITNKGGGNFRFESLTVLFNPLTRRRGIQ